MPTSAMKFISVASYDGSLVGVDLSNKLWVYNSLTELWSLF